MLIVVIVQILIAAWNPYSVTAIKPSIHLRWDPAMELKTQKASRRDRNCGTNSIFTDSITQVHVSEGSAGYVWIHGDTGVTMETGMNVYIFFIDSNFFKETEIFYRKL